MSSKNVRSPRRTPLRRGNALMLGMLAAGVFAGTAIADSSPAAPDLGAAEDFAVLAATTVTNTGPTAIVGDLGLHPGSSITGFPPGTLTGSIYAASQALVVQAKADTTDAYADIAGRLCDTANNLSGQDLEDLTLTPGLYCFDSEAQLSNTAVLGTGTLTLDAEGDADAVFIFQIASTLTTISTTSVNLVNGAQSCNVFWQAGSSVTIGTFTTFHGNLLSRTSITLTDGATVHGRALALEAAVTMDDNKVTRANCATPA
jgi:hypothetical protein